jgi:hypothetical protein
LDKEISGDEGEEEEEEGEVDLVHVKLPETLVIVPRFIECTLLFFKVIILKIM